jgi:copper chaperone CopZ
MNHMKRIALMTLMLLSVSTPTLFAQIIQMDLSIFGMDCAICAHGVHKTLLKIEGVQKVDVSIEKGLAHIELNSENKVQLQQLENAVRKNGFSPKGGTVDLKGKIQNKGGDSITVIVSGTNEGISGTMSQAASIDPQKEYSIRGVLKIDEKGTQSLNITSAN